MDLYLRLLKPFRELAALMRFVVRRYDSVPRLDNTPTEMAPCEDDSLDTVGGMDMADVVNRGRSFARRQMRRLVCKDGELNINKGVSSKRCKFALDLFTTLLDLKWRFIVLLFASGFLLSWLTFGLLWWLLAMLHGDYQKKDDSSSCVENVHSFASALLYSIETQHTIGYGLRVIQDHCLPGYALLMCQSCLGVFIQSLLAGLIFAKLSRPKRRSRTIMFSKQAVICRRDGQLCLLFRIGDMRKSHIVGSTIRAVMVKNRLTQEGELIPLYSLPLKVVAETMLPDDNFVFMAWPISVVHIIDEDSPLWDISAEQLLEEKLEIVVVLEGCVESTGMTVQLRTSYLPSEILWGYHLAPLVTYQKDNGTYKIDYTQFHSIIPIMMPECSAKELRERRTTISKIPEYPVNFTAPTGMPLGKRTWSLRYRGGLLRNSLRKKCALKEKSGSVHSVRVVPVIVSDEETRNGSSTTGAAVHDGDTCSSSASALDIC